MKFWANIGLQPFDFNCLQDDKVKNKVVGLPDSKIAVYSDPLGIKLLNIEDLNKKINNILIMYGLDGDFFRKHAPRIELSTMKIGVTTPFCRERPYLLIDRVSAGFRVQLVMST